MRKVNRPPTPEVLKENWKAWGKHFHSTDTGFHWHEREGITVNKIIEPDLCAMTSHHCAFCDGYPLGAMATFTIEHFRPKQLFKKIAYYWGNLFPCCNACQKATNLAWRTAFDKRALKPDGHGFDFCRYFVADFVSGQIEINPAATQSDQERAEITIRAYDLNSAFRCKLRRSILGDFHRGQAEAPPKILDDYSYRFFIEAGI